MIILLSSLVIFLTSPLADEDIDYLFRAHQKLIDDDWAGALADSEEAFLLSNENAPHHYYNAAYAAVCAGETNISLKYLYKRFMIEPDWYGETLPTNPVFEPLHSKKGWRPLIHTLSLRKYSQQRNFDHDLRAELL